jgi:hypothetical protein
MSTESHLCCRCDVFIQQPQAPHQQHRCINLYKQGQVHSVAEHQYTREANKTNYKPATDVKHVHQSIHPQKMKINGNLDLLSLSIKKKRTIQPILTFNIIFNL